MHYMPHDIETNVLGMERTRKAQFTAGGVSPMTAVPQISSVEEGIEQTRDIFPEVALHKTNCERGIECLANYRYNYNEDKDSYTMNPHHDWASNGADAFRQMPQGYTVEKEKVDKRGKVRRKNKGSWMS
jgi:phage terminase large subunit